MATEKQKKRQRGKYRAKIKRNNKRAWIIISAIFLAIIFGRLILPFVWGPIGVNINYSTGERTAVIIKISEKGLIWKTWEGEAVLSQRGFAVTYIWPFSIDSEDPNKEVLLQKVMRAFETGETVKIAYEEKAGYVPWRSKTPYLIKEIRFSG